MCDARPNLTITGVSQWICEEAKKGIFKDKRIITINNGIDTSIFKPTHIQDIEHSESLEKLEYSLKGNYIIM